MTGVVPGLCVLYRWRLRPGTELRFIEAWSRVTLLLREQRGALGSRLHRADDGTWYAYAQWPSSAARDAAFHGEPVDPLAAQEMRDAIEERFPEVLLECVRDHLVFGG